MTSVLQAIDVKKLYKIGTNDIWALKNINIDIQNGEFLSIIGKSGSGKSTLMHIMGLLDTPTSGRVILNGEDVSNLPESRLAKVRNNGIGFVFQSFNLLSRATALENVMLPLSYSTVPYSERRGRAEQMLVRVGLKERMSNRSNELSGGQKQRVAIARALVNDPAIILADEPTGNLDSKMGEEIFEIFHELNREGKTIVIVTHDDEIAARTPRKIVIKDGEVVNGL